MTSVEWERLFQELGTREGEEDGFRYEMGFHMRSEEGSCVSEPTKGKGNYSYGGNVLFWDW